MKPVFVDLWGWFHAYAGRAYRSEDPRKIRLTRILDDAWEFFETEPDRSFAFLSEGVQLAKQLQEPWWVVFYEYWQCEAYLFYLLDNPAAMNLAVRLTVEIQKPQYEQCPVRARIYRILVDTYLYADSLGYAEEISTNLDHLENTIPLDEDTWKLIEARRTNLAVDTGNYTQALEHAQLYLSRSQGSHFRLSHAYDLLCSITYKLNDLPAMFEYAKAGKTSAEYSDRIQSVSNFQVWQAVYLESTGAHAEAQRLVRSALRKASKLHNPFSPDALCIFYEKAGKLERSLEICRLQLEKAIKGGEMFDAAYRRLVCCQLLAKLGKPIEQEAALARQALGKLRKPERLLNLLEQIEQGKPCDL